MTALPIVNRELRVVARRPSTYWVRSGIALLACFIGAYLVLIVSKFNMGFVGKQIVYSMCSSMVGIYALFGGMRASADHISIEKREGTLGLLFLTDLKSYDVVLGKLCSTAIHSLYGMLAAFPILGIALIGGGITGSEFLRGSLALLNVVFFAHSAGLAVSAFSLNNRRALGSAIFIGFIFMWGIPAVTSILLINGWTKTSSLLSVLSPLNALQLAVASMPMSATSVMFGGSLGRFGINTFWVCLLVSNLLGWLWLAIACWRVPRSWQNVGATTPWRMRLHNLAYGSTTARTAFRRKLVSVNPFYWLASRTRFDPHLTLLWLIVPAAFIVWVTIKVRGPFTACSILLIVALHLILRVGLAASAARNFAEQRRTGALEFLLACTPMDTKDIVRGQWLALRRQFLIPLIIILGFDIFSAIFVWMSGTNPGFDAEDRRNYLLFVSAMTIMLIADVLALGWAGMWAGISVNKANRASGAAVTRVMIGPTAAAVVLFATFTDLFQHVNNNSGYFFLAFWFLIGIGCDIFWMIYSRRSLYKNFRTLAATPYEEQSGIMAAIGRALGAATRSRSRAGTATPPPIPGS